jgi:hypothetical protein
MQKARSLVKNLMNGESENTTNHTDFVTNLMAGRNEMTTHFSKSHWSGLKLTTEDMLFIKYQYNYIQCRKLEAFIDEIKRSKPNLLKFIDLVETPRHLTPFVIVYDKPETSIKYFWVVTWNLNMFNLSYREVTSTKKNREISPGHTAFDAKQAVKVLLKGLKWHSIHLNPSRSDTPHKTKNNKDKGGKMHGIGNPSLDDNEDGGR